MTEEDARRLRALGAERGRERAEDDLDHEREHVRAVWRDQFSQRARDSGAEPLEDLAESRIFGGEAGTGEDADVWYEGFVSAYMEAIDAAFAKARARGRRRRGRSRRRRGR